MAFFHLVRENASNPQWLTADLPPAPDPPTEVTRLLQSEGLGDYAGAINNLGFTTLESIAKDTTEEQWLKLSGLKIAWATRVRNRARELCKLEVNPVEGLELLAAHYQDCVPDPELPSKASVAPVGNEVRYPGDSPEAVHHSSTLGSAGPGAAAAKDTILPLNRSRSPMQPQPQPELTAEEKEKWDMSRVNASAQKYLDVLQGKWQTEDGTLIEVKRLKVIDHTHMLEAALTVSDDGELLLDNTPIIKDKSWNELILWEDDDAWYRWGTRCPNPDCRKQCDQNQRFCGHCAAEITWKQADSLRSGTVMLTIQKVDGKIGWRRSPDLYITLVEEGSPAHVAGVEKGMHILEVNDEPVKTAEQFKQRLESVGQNASFRVLMRYPRRAASPDLSEALGPGLSGSNREAAGAAPDSQKMEDFCLGAKLQVHVRNIRGWWKWTPATVLARTQTDYKVRLHSDASEITVKPTEMRPWIFGHWRYIDGERGDKDDITFRITEATQNMLGHMAQQFPFTILQKGKPKPDRKTGTVECLTVLPSMGRVYVLWERSEQRSTNAFRKKYTAQLNSHAAPPTMEGEWVIEQSRTAAEKGATGSFRLEFLYEEPPKKAAKRKEAEAASSLDGLISETQPRFSLTDPPKPLSKMTKSERAKWDTKVQDERRRIQRARKALRKERERQAEREEEEKREQRRERQRHLREARKEAEAQEERLKAERKAERAARRLAEQQKEQEQLDLKRKRKGRGQAQEAAAAEEDEFALPGDAEEPASKRRRVGGAAAAAAPAPAAAAAAAAPDKPLGYSCNVSPWILQKARGEAVTLPPRHQDAAKRTLRLWDKIVDMLNRGWSQAKIQKRTKLSSHYVIQVALVTPGRKQKKKGLRADMTGVVPGLEEPKGKDEKKEKEKKEEGEDDAEEEAEEGEEEGEEEEESEEEEEVGGEEPGSDEEMTDEDRERRKAEKVIKRNLEEAKVTALVKSLQGLWLYSDGCGGWDGVVWEILPIGQIKIQEMGERQPVARSCVTQQKDRGIKIYFERRAETHSKADVMHSQSFLTLSPDGNSMTGEYSIIWASGSYAGIRGDTGAITLSRITPEALGHWIYFSEAQGEQGSRGIQVRPDGSMKWKLVDSEGQFVPRGPHGGARIFFSALSGDQITMTEEIKKQGGWWKEAVVYTGRMEDGADGTRVIRGTARVEQVVRPRGKPQDLERLHQSWDYELRPAPPQKPLLPAVAAAAQKK